MNQAARLSGIVLIVIGVAILAISVGGTARALLDPAWLDGQIAAAGPALQDHPMFRPPVLSWIILVSGLLGLVESGLSVVLGIYTYKGRRWAILTSIILSGLRLLIVGLLLLLQVLVASLGQSTPTIARDLLFAGGATIILLGLIGLLIAALREPGAEPPRR
jgi:hypothetical protein